MSPVLSELGSTCLPQEFEKERRKMFVLQKHLWSRTLSSSSQVFIRLSAAPRGRRPSAPAGAAGETEAPKALRLLLLAGHSFATHSQCDPGYQLPTWAA